MRSYSDYEKLERLGEGTFGVVHKARHRETGDMVALKKMRLDGEEDGVPATALREIATLRELKHQNVIELQHVFHIDRSLYLAFEFCDCDLKQHMRSMGNKLPPDAVQSYCWQMLNGLTWCHSHRIFHRDLKPQNLLVQPAKGLLKLGDFGLTRAFSLPLRTYTHEVVTLWYRAPEILLGAKDYACPIDIVHTRSRAQPHLSAPGPCVHKACPTTMLEGCGLALARRAVVGRLCTGRDDNGASDVPRRLGDRRALQNISGFWSPEQLPTNRAPSSRVTANACNIKLQD